MNKIIISGRLTRDPELKTANSGTELCKFTVAVERRRKDRNDQKVTDFLDCTAWGRTGVFVNTYFHKGDGITVEGRMESEKWTDRDGNKRTSWGVQVETVEFPLSRAQDRDGLQENYTRAPNGAVNVPPPTLEEAPDDEGGELPF